MQNLSNSPVKKRENQRTLLHLPEAKSFTEGLQSKQTMLLLPES